MMKAWLRLWICNEGLNNMNQALWIFPTVFTEWLEWRSIIIWARAPHAGLWVELLLQMSFGWWIQIKLEMDVYIVLSFCVFVFVFLMHQYLMFCLRPRTWILIIYKKDMMVSCGGFVRVYTLNRESWDTDPAHFVAGIHSSQQNGIEQ